MADLRQPRWMLVKAILFVAIGLLAGGMLLAESWTMRTAALLGLCVWAFARAYYFLFYVITSYIDPTFRYAGIFSAVLHFFSRRTPR
jgi:hypothetical protein